MPDVTSNDGIRLLYADTGHGRPLILIHGWTFSGRCFQRNIDALAKPPASSALICVAATVWRHESRPAPVAPAARLHLVLLTRGVLPEQERLA